MWHVRSWIDIPPSVLAQEVHIIAQFTEQQTTIESVKVRMAVTSGVAINGILAYRWIEVGPMSKTLAPSPATEPALVFLVGVDISVPRRV